MLIKTGFRTIFAVAGLLLAMVVFLPASAQAPVQERVNFEPGADGTVITNTIEGYEVIDYLVQANAGQRLMVSMETDNTANYFNVAAPGEATAMHIGSTIGNQFEAGLPADGDYTVRVYLMRSAARRNETADYSLAINVFGPGGNAAMVAAPENDYADGMGGGPDFWEVTGVGGGDSLNLRSGPSTGDAIIGKLVNGDVLRNMGCQMTGDMRWCKVEPSASGAPVGWVAGKFLRESSGGSTDATVQASVPKGNGQPFHAIGEIPCALNAGQPAGSCKFGVIREGNGNAGVWIDMNGDGERYFTFEDGKPVYTDSSEELIFEKNADLYLLKLGEQERYEIPEAVIFGG